MALHLTGFAAQVKWFTQKRTQTPDHPFFVKLPLLSTDKVGKNPL